MKSIVQFLGGVVGFVATQAGILGILPHAAQVAVQAIAGGLTVMGIRNAAQSPPNVVQWLNNTGKHWKTLVGVVVAIVGGLGSPDVAGLLPAGVAHFAIVCGTVLAALGLYHAQVQ